MNRRLPKYVTEFVDRHGKVRVRYRRKGHPDHYFASVPWSAEFMAEYRACEDATALPATNIGASRTKPGTISALIAAYYGAPEFTGLRPSTRATYRNILERFREKHGDKRVATIERQHIKAIIGSMSATPGAANNLLDRIKVLMAFAVDIGMRKDDPTIRLRGYPEGEGFHSWNEAEIAQFEARHPLGSRARLALALMLYTGQRRSDVIGMGWQHVKADRITVRQIKTDVRLEIRIHPKLAAVLADAPRANLTFLVTSQGRPFTSNGFGNWFRDRCNEAGLPRCSAHGLRKAASRRLAEARCSNPEIKAITGHKTDKEIARYTAAADQVVLADQAMEAYAASDREQTLSNPAKG